MNPHTTDGRAAIQGIYRGTLHSLIAVAPAEGVLWVVGRDMYACRLHIRVCTVVLKDPLHRVYKAYNPYTGTYACSIQHAGCLTTARDEATICQHGF